MLKQAYICRKSFIYTITQCHSFTIIFLSKSNGRSMMPIINFFFFFQSCRERSSHPLYPTKPTLSLLTMRSRRKKLPNKCTALSKPTRPLRLLRCVIQPKKSWAVCGGQPAADPSPVKCRKLKTHRHRPDFTIPVVRSISSPILAVYVHIPPVQIKSVSHQNRFRNWNSFVTNSTGVQDLIKASSNQKSMALYTIGLIPMLPETLLVLIWCEVFLPKKKEQRLMRRAKTLSTEFVTNFLIAEIIVSDHQKREISGGKDQKNGGEM